MSINGEELDSAMAMDGEYPVKTFLRMEGVYPMGGVTEEESDYFGALLLMEMMMEGRPTMFTREGECLDADEAAETAASAWDTDADKLIAKAREWEPLLKLRREDPDRYRREMAKRMRERLEQSQD